MIKKSNLRRKIGVKSRLGRNNQRKRVTKIDNESDRWMRDKIQMYNDEGKRISVEMLVPIAKKERREKGENRYPPGKDKQQEIVRRWVDKGYAKRDQKNGIILLDMKEIKRLPNLAKIELMNAEQTLQELEEINNQKKSFSKLDFFKFIMLKKKFLYIPTKFLLYSKQTQIIKNEIHIVLITYVEKKLKQMELLKGKQRNLKNKKLFYNFESIENLVEEIVEFPESFDQPIIDDEEYAELKSKHDEIGIILDF